MRREYLIAALLMAAGPLFAGNDARGREDAEPATYCLYEIGRLPGLPPGEISLELVGINNRNQIVGWTGLAGTPPLHSFIWDRQHGMRDLGTVPGHPNLLATAVNDAGVVIGEATDLETETLAFAWRRGRGVRTLDTSLGGVNSFATDINRRGQIVGASETETGEFHAFLRDVNGEVLDLGALPGGSGVSSASAMNDRGQVVGTRAVGGVVDAFIWDERRGMRALIEDTGPNFFAFPLDINERGEVVGDILGTEPQRAFRWTRGEGVQFLGTLSGVETDFATARAINRWGTIVGGSQAAPGGEVHGFVWTRKRGMRDLNEVVDAGSGMAGQVVLGAAVGVNDFGGIAVIGFVPGEESQRGFLALPRRQPHKACP
jgi:probable HAF family extracellular repeat protein